MPRFSRDRRRPGRDDLQSLVDQRLGQHGGSGRPVAGDVVGLGGDLFDQLRPQVLVGVLQFDLAGDRDAVVGDGGRAPTCR